ncbi:MAG: ankyrin repeat domain-containing protein [Pseudomonadota bacterium]
MKKKFCVIATVIFLVTLTGCGSGLIQAAKKGDVSTLQKLMDQGSDINESAMGVGAMTEGTPLFYAVYNCHVEAVRYLVSKGADVEAAGFFKGGFFSGRPLHAAVEKDCIESVRILLDAGADIDAKANGITGSALAIAASNNNVKILKYLISRGADVDDAITMLRKNGANNAVALLEKYDQPTATAVVTPSKALVAPVVRSDVDVIPDFRIPQRPNALAVVIGVEQYRQKLPKADFAAQDAKIVADYLVKVMGYPEENVVLLTNDKALQSDMAKYFEKWLGNNVEKDSTVFIYYSGHGAPDPKTGNAYMVPYDGDPSFITETGYSLKRMYDALGKLPAKEIIVALDSCFSGAGGRSVIAKGARPLVMNLQSDTVLSKNMTVLSASAGDQISSTYDDKGHGLFTYFLLKGIKNEDVVNPDGSIKMDDLFGYLAPQVERIARKQYNNEQTPQLIEAK